jgi:hypothetical protein
MCNLYSQLRDERRKGEKGDRRQATAQEYQKAVVTAGLTLLSVAQVIGGTQRLSHHVALKGEWLPRM